MYGKRSDQGRHHRRRLCGFTAWQLSKLNMEPAAGTDTHQSAGVIRHHDNTAEVTAGRGRRPCERNTSILEHGLTCGWGYENVRMMRECYDEVKRKSGSDSTAAAHGSEEAFIPEPTWE